MKLADYLAKHDISQSAFAKKAGLDRAIVNKVLSGKRKRFSVTAALAVVDATRGAVSLEECLGAARGRR